MSRNRHHDYLKSVSLFSGLDNHDLDVVGKAVTELSFKAGDVVMHEGAPARELVIVLDGTLEVSQHGEVIAEVGPGGFAGEMGLLTDSIRHATVTAKTDVRLLHLDSRSFATVLNEAPEVAVKMLPVVAARAVEADARHSD